MAVDRRHGGFYAAPPLPITPVSGFPTDSHAAYRETGLLFPVRVLEADEARRFRAASDDMESRLGGKPLTIQVRQMHLHLAWAHELATHPGILDAVQPILGPDILVWATELFAKHPGDSGVAIHWHRDKPYMGFDSATTVTAWVSLGLSIPENGCMRAVPDPERAATVCEVESKSDRRHAGPGIRVVPLREDRIVDVVLQPGEMSLHDCDILHGSSANLSAEKRVGFVIRFVSPEIRLSEKSTPLLQARGSRRPEGVRIADPPVETDPDRALEAMKRSAAEHLDLMLANLKRARIA